MTKEKSELLVFVIEI